MTVIIVSETMLGYLETCYVAVWFTDNYSYFCVLICSICKTVFMLLHSDNNFKSLFNIRLFFLYNCFITLKVREKKEILDNIIHFVNDWRIIKKISIWFLRFMT
jgi:hypothetical protein